MSSDIVIHLKNLKEKYQKGLVSVIVGAGFSRNACEDYPLWQDLLSDMVVDLYKEEIETSYLRYKEINPGDKTSLDDFTKDEIPNIIRKVGYLRLVSEFISQKGYREAIEHYIEERIPYIDTDSGKFKYAGKNKSKTTNIVPENFAAHTKLLEGRNWERIYTTNYDGLLEYALDKADMKFNVITKAKDLSVSRETPSIIKLHGDLFNPLKNKKRVFMFDGNPHQQYIISEEDYETYPHKHEAFTQLMRISLLQGAFCLIGFSGDDPNFINWINWVRDVLVTDESIDADDKSRYKIFLIGMTKDDPDEVRRIFYENHNIIYIPLLRDEIKDIINANGVIEARELFCKFFEYLYTSKTDGELSLEDVQSGKSYAHLWDSVYNIKYDNVNPMKLTPKIFVDDEKLDKLYALKYWNRFVYYSHRQITFLHEVECQKELTTAESRLALLALRDSGLPIDNKLISLISKSDIADEDVEILNNLIERAQTLYSLKFDEFVVKGNKYEEIIRSLFSLDFKRVETLLTDWIPNGTDLIKKAIVLSLFDKKTASNMLMDYIKHEPSSKEQFYATRMLNFVEDSIPLRYSVDRFENANVQDYNKVLSNLKLRVLENKEKIGRYGEAIKQKVFYFGGVPTKTPEAMSLINFLIEAPAFVSYKNFYTLISSEDWYKIHKNIYEKCPLPTLYFSLQCTDEKVKTRIGQDYAYSDQLANGGLDYMLGLLLKAYLAEETPKYLLSSILIVAKELFVAVKPHKWEDLFLQIWEEVVLKYRFVEDAKDRIFDDLDKFVMKGLNSLKSLTLRQKIIKDVLVNVKKDTGFVINCLYYLHVVPKDLKGEDGLLSVVDEFVAGISSPSELNVAGNIYRLLTDYQRELCSQKCVVLLQNRENEINDIVYQVSQYFVKEDAKRRAVFVKSICENQLLWKNGVMKDGGFSSFYFLHLSSFTRKVYIDQTSLIFIFERMKKSANEVLTYTEKYGDMLFISPVTNLLIEMISFLNYYEKRLIELDGYYDIRKQIVETYRKLSGLVSVEDGLLSIYEEELHQSLIYIRANHDVFTHKEVINFIDIIIKRVQMKNSDGLDTCIAYLSLFLKERLINKEDIGLIDGLVKILDRYTKEEVQKCNMDLVMTARHLGKIAMFLRKIEIQSEGVNYWIRFKKESHFYTNWG